MVISAVEWEATSAARTASALLTFLHAKHRWTSSSSASNLLQRARPMPLRKQLGHRTYINWDSAKWRYFFLWFRKQIVLIWAPMRNPSSENTQTLFKEGRNHPSKLSVICSGWCMVCLFHSKTMQYIAGLHLELTVLMMKGIQYLTSICYFSCLLHVLLQCLCFSTTRTLLPVNSIATIKNNRYPH